MTDQPNMREVTVTYRATRNFLWPADEQNSRVVDMMNRLKEGYPTWDYEVESVVPIERRNTDFHFGRRSEWPGGRRSTDHNILNLTMVRPAAHSFPDDGDPHTEMLKHLIDEWGASGTLKQLLTVVGFGANYRDYLVALVQSRTNRTVTG